MGWTRGGGARGRGRGRLQDGLHRDRTVHRGRRRRPYPATARSRPMAVCSLGLPERAWASVRPEAAIDYLDVAIDKTADLGGEALSGVIFGGIGERTGVPPTVEMTTSPARLKRGEAAKTRGIELGIEAVNRYENHLINTASRSSADRACRRRQCLRPSRHLSHEHRGEGRRQGILLPRPPQIHPSFRERPGHAGLWQLPWDAIYGALAAIGFKGGLAMESFINMPPEIGRPRRLAPGRKERSRSYEQGLPFLRNKALQYGRSQ